MRLVTPYLDQLAPVRRKEISADALSATGGSGSGGSAAAGALHGGWDDTVDHHAMRQWVDSNWMLFAIIGMRCSQLANADWDINAIDRQEDWDRGVRDEIVAKLQNPNPGGRNNTWREWISGLVRDSLVIDNAAFQVITDDRPAPDALPLLDGARLVERPAWQKDADGPRYVYLNEDYSGRGKPLLSEEVVHIVASTHSYKPTGLAPIKVLNRILRAEWDTFRSVHILQRNRAPAGLLVVPNSSPQTIETLKDLFLTEMAGKSGVGFADVPAETTFIELGSIDLEKQGAFAFYDMLVRACVAAFHTTTLAISWLQDTNRATAREQAEIIDDGLITIMETFQSVIQEGIVKRWPGAENLQFSFRTLTTRDEAQHARTIRERMGPLTNWSSINQAAIDDGRDPWLTEKEGGTLPDYCKPWLEEPLAPAGNGLQLPVSIVAQQYNPDANPVALVPGPAGPGEGATGPAPNGTAAGELAGALGTVTRSALPRRRPQLPAHPAPPGGQRTTPEEEMRAGHQNHLDEMDALFEEVRNGRRQNGR